MELRQCCRVAVVIADCFTPHSGLSSIHWREARPKGRKANKRARLSKYHVTRDHLTLEVYLILVQWDQWSCTCYRLLSRAREDRQLSVHQHKTLHPAGTSLFQQCLWLSIPCVCLCLCVYVCTCGRVRTVCAVRTVCRLWRSVCTVCVHWVHTLCILCVHCGVLSWPTGMHYVCTGNNR